MLRIEDEDGGVIRIRADSLLTTEDYAEFVPDFERLVGGRHRPIPMLIELGPSFGGWTLGGLWRDLKFDVEHRQQFGRIAIVGDEKWQEWGSEASNLFFDAEVRFFERSHRQDAEQWLGETVRTRS